jgi:hypothetical protein
MARKRAPGGGRKPKGDTTRTAQLTVRVPKAMRSQLELGARERGWTLTDELMWRLRNSFNREREERRDPAIRALSYLIAELAHHVASGAYMGDREFALYSWRRSPFCYRALKIAVGKLFDALEPPGPVTLPTIDVDNPERLDSYTQRWIDSFGAPESRAEFAVNHVLAALRTLPRVSEEQREENRRLIGEHSSIMHQFYGMSDAARDLALRPRDMSGLGERVPIKLDINVIKLNTKQGD